MRTLAARIVDLVIHRHRQPAPSQKVSRPGAVTVTPETVTPAESAPASL